MEENQPHETKGGSMNPTLIIVAIVVIALIGWAFWSMNNGKKTDQKMDAMTMKATASPTSTMQTQPSESVSPTSSSAMEDTSDVKVVDVEAGSYYFKPNEIHVKKGQKVKIVMTSKDMMHSLDIDEFNVKLPVTRAGETNTVEFTADKAGTFEYYCSVAQHRKLGQVGKLIVE